ncbi:Uncharacterized protein Fot_10011 [Forsythia ovata]|uniref:Uncharacterized protein n=1 Tax=Forsythia ovata TaxID=205694 RepID=A0ABD1WG07_9LAMI
MVLKGTLGSEPPSVMLIKSMMLGVKGELELDGGNDENEQTLNQFLTEMDGFEGNTGFRATVEFAFWAHGSQPPTCPSSAASLPQLRCLYLSYPKQLESTITSNLSQIQNNLNQMIIT